MLAFVAVAVALATRGEEPADRAQSPAREAQSSGDGETSSKPKPSEPDEEQAAAPPSSQPSAGGEAAPSGAASSGGSPVALNDEGFRLLNARRYDEAVPVLERAYEACGKGVGDLTCAYAAFNLGRALRLAGRPDEAIPVLEKRLENPNQRDTVQAELDAAKRAAKDG